MGAGPAAPAGAARPAGAPKAPPAAPPRNELPQAGTREILLDLHAERSAVTASPISEIGAVFSSQEATTPKPAQAMAEKTSDRDESRRNPSAAIETSA
jgi:hypothetical protein